MAKKTTYADLLGSRQQELLVTSVVEALREGTTLDTTLDQFIEGIAKTAAVKEVAGRITLGQIFSGLRDLEEPIDGRRRGRKKSGKRGGRRAKRQRADADTVKKRLDAIHKVLVENGGWMKTGEIFDIVSKQKLFDGVVTNTLSQYLAKFSEERPKRVRKKGERAASVYRAA